MTVRLVHITLPAFRALEAGDLATAERLLGVAVPDEFAAPIEIWTFMIGLAQRPDNVGWLMRAVVADDVAVGNAGFKGSPVDGQVELGYRISPTHRRRGLATDGVSLLLAEARRDPDVQRVIARIAPGNDASVAVVTSSGFVPDGEHPHPRWGRQLQFVHATPDPDE